MGTTALPREEVNLAIPKHGSQEQAKERNTKSMDRQMG